MVRREVENTCDKKKKSSDRGVLEQQHDHSCISSLVLKHFSLIMQRNGEPSLFCRLCCVEKWRILATSAMRVVIMACWSSSMITLAF